MGKVLLIVNPSSGKEKGKLYQEKAEVALKNRYDEVEVRLTEKAGDATDFASWAAKQGFEAVIAMGGDGTLNETINGLAIHENRPDFGFIPLGTVNDLARSVGIPLKPEKAIQSLETSVAVPMDIGRIGELYFMNVLAIGMIAQAVDQVSVEQKTKFGSVAYFLEGLKAFNRNELLHFKLEYDDEIGEGEAALVVAGLTKSVGGIESWAPDAKIDDGYLHVVILTKLGLLDAANLIPQLIRGNLKNSDGVVYIKTKKLKIDASGEDLSINVDGDPGPGVPAEIEVLGSHLNILAPKENSTIRFGPFVLKR
ncbi:diacylglycerol kinase family lipid kinase [Listeria ivanovii]|uniref:diacylglycerol/lipid kinase family protein n=1 Tax=Listeria ivanovii TaxID=1638 RepID=UPI00162A3FC9|nr:diacylglycerol kinase family protein [Listeria ivanovii]MBC1758566.1 diacylglycerol kinase family lipid kinase [Listeria ivanovii]